MFFLVQHWPKCITCIGTRPGICTLRYWDSWRFFFLSLFVCFFLSYYFFFGIRRITVVQPKGHKKSGRINQIKAFCIRKLTFRSREAIESRSWSYSQVPLSVPCFTSGPAWMRCTYACMLVYRTLIYLE